MEIDRNKADAPPVMMRVMTAERPEGITLPDDIPNYSGHSGRFMLRLMAALGCHGVQIAEVPLSQLIDKIWNGALHDHGAPVRVMLWLRLVSENFCSSFL